MSDWLTSRSQFDDVTREGNVVVLFTAPAWCIPCQRFEPHWDRAVAVSAENKLPIKFFRVDLDNNEWATLDFDVFSVPTCHLWVDGNHERNIKVPQGGHPFLKELTNELGV